MNGIEYCASSMKGAKSDIQMMVYDCRPLHKQPGLSVSRRKELRFRVMHCPAQIVLDQTRECHVFWRRFRSHTTIGGVRAP